MEGYELYLGTVVCTPHTTSWACVQDFEEKKKSSVFHFAGASSATL